MNNDNNSDSEVNIGSNPDPESEDRETLDKFLSIECKSSLACQLQEVTALYCTLGYSLTKSFEKATMLIVKLTTGSPL